MKQIPSKYLEQKDWDEYKTQLINCVEEQLKQYSNKLLLNNGWIVFDIEEWAMDRWTDKTINIVGTSFIKGKKRSVDITLDTLDVHTALNNKKFIKLLCSEPWNINSYFIEEEWADERNQ